MSVIAQLGAQEAAPVAERRARARDAVSSGPGLQLAVGGDSASDT